MSLNFLFRGFENLKENKEYSRIGEKPDKLKLAVKTQVHVRINSCFFSDLLIGILNDEMPNFTILHPFHQIDYQKFEKTLLWKNPYFIGPSLLKFIVLVLIWVLLIWWCCVYFEVDTIHTVHSTTAQHSLFLTVHKCFLTEWPLLWNQSGITGDVGKVEEKIDIAIYLFSSTTTKHIVF